VSRTWSVELHLDPDDARLPAIQLEAGQAGDVTWRQSLPVRWRATARGSPFRGEIVLAASALQANGVVAIDGPHLGAELVLAAGAEASGDLRLPLLRWRMREQLPIEALSLRVLLYDEQGRRVFDRQSLLRLGLLDAAKTPWVRIAAEPAERAANADPEHHVMHVTPEAFSPLSVPLATNWGARVVVPLSVWGRLKPADRRWLLRWSTVAPLFLVGLPPPGVEIPDAEYLPVRFSPANREIEIPTIAGPPRRLHSAWSWEPRHPGLASTGEDSPWAVSLGPITFLAFDPWTPPWSGDPDTLSLLAGMFATPLASADADYSRLRPDAPPRHATYHWLALLAALAGPLAVLSFRRRLRGRLWLLGGMTVVQMCLVVVARASMTPVVSTSERTSLDLFGKWRTETVRAVAVAFDRDATVEIAAPPGSPLVPELSPAYRLDYWDRDHDDWRIVRTGDFWRLRSPGSFGALELGAGPTLEMGGVPGAPPTVRIDPQGTWIEATIPGAVAGGTALVTRRGIRWGEGESALLEIPAGNLAAVRGRLDLDDRIRPLVGSSPDLALAGGHLVILWDARHPEHTSVHTVAAASSGRTGSVFRTVGCFGGRTRILGIRWPESPFAAANRLVVKVPETLELTSTDAIVTAGGRTTRVPVRFGAEQHRGELVFSAAALAAAWGVGEPCEIEIPAKPVATPTQVRLAMRIE